jgi:uncharacterized repeat protein (TIGR02543 family)
VALLLGPVISLATGQTSGAPVTVSLVLSPPGGGTVTVNGVTYTASQGISLRTGNYNLSESPSPGYVFAGWGSSGGASVSNGSLVVTAAGNLYANFTTYSSVTFGVFPSLCGPVSFNGTLWSNGSRGTFPSPVTYVASVSACPGYTFQGWNATPAANLSLTSPSNLTTPAALGGNATLTASFLPNSDLVRIVILPGQDGGVKIDKTLYGNGSTATLLSGTHLVSPVANPWGLFSGWNASGNLSLGGTSFTPTLTVWGNGTLTVRFLFAPALTIQVSPPTGGTVLLNGTSYGNGSVVHLPVSGSPYPLLAQPSGSSWFSGWSGTNVSFQNALVYQTNLSILGNGTLTLEVVPRPVFSVQIQTNPSACGTVTLNGTTYRGGSLLSLPGSTGGYPLSATPCSGYVLQGIGTTALLGYSNTTGLVSVMGNGTIWANFTSPTDLMMLSVSVSPAACGPIHLANGTIASGGVTTLRMGSYPLLAPLCPGFAFAGWGVKGAGLSVSPSSSVNATLNLSGNGTLFANYSRVSSAKFTVTVTSQPTSCGPVSVNGTLVGNGNHTVLTSGPYAISAAACPSYQFLGWSLSGSGLSVVNATAPNTTLDLGGNGTVTAIYATVGTSPFTVDLSLFPSACSNLSLNGTSYGNGAKVSLRAGVYSLQVPGCSGHERPYTVVSPPLALLSPGNLLAVAGNGTVSVVYPAPLSAGLSGDASGAVGSSLSVQLTISGGLAPYSIYWIFGDGQHMSLVENSTNLTVLHTYDSSGQFTVVVYVTDLDGVSSIVSWNLTVGQTHTAAPPLWQQTEFRLLLSALVVALILVAVALILTRRKRPPQEEAPAKEEEEDAGSTSTDTAKESTSEEPGNADKSPPETEKPDAETSSSPAEEEPASTPTDTPASPLESKPDDTSEETPEEKPAPEPADGEAPSPSASEEPTDTGNQDNEP